MMKNHNHAHAPDEDHKMTSSMAEDPRISALIIENHQNRNGRFRIMDRIIRSDNQDHVILSESHRMNPINHLETSETSVELKTQAARLANSHQFDQLNSTRRRLSQFDEIDTQRINQTDTPTENDRFLQRRKPDSCTTIDETDNDDAATSILTVIQPVLFILRFCGFFDWSELRSYVQANRPSPNAAPNRWLNNQSIASTRLVTLCRRVSWLLWMFGLAYLNVVVTRDNLEALIGQSTVIGTYMHVFVAGSVIAMVKPFINLMHLFLFSVTVRRHRTFLHDLDAVVSRFGGEFGSSRLHHRVRVLNCVSVGTVFLVCVLFLAIRIIGAWAMSHPETPELFDWSIPLAPILGVWNVVPLLYFTYMSAIIVLLIEQLLRQITRRRVSPGSIKFFYGRFSELVHLLQRFSMFFNPFIGFSFLWTVGVLCLGIYYVTMASLDTLTQPFDGFPTTYLHKFDIILYILLTWILLQVIIAVATVVTLCNVGRCVNEKIRSVFYRVLLVTNRHEEPPTAEDNFYINAFSHFIQLQNAWGISVWRAFPLERSSFFQLATLIFTYTMVLLKFGDTAHKLKAQQINGVVENNQLVPVNQAVNLTSVSNETLETFFRF